MRSEKEMFELIINIARNDERIRAVFMNGSRTNPNAPKDIFQDYDIVYVVKETQSFIDDKSWPDRFGDILFMQYPDEFPDLYPEEAVPKSDRYAWLMQFKDGTRIDLTVMSIEYAKTNILTDSLCEIILDKDNCLPEIPESSDEMYRVKKPTERIFLCTCNEFWWCLDNVAKGLWRKEIPYVQDMLSQVVRNQLEKVLCWKAGILTDFTVSTGKSAKYLYRWLSPDEWQRYLDTYAGGNVTDIWNAVGIMCDLFYETAKWVASRLGYDLCEEEALNCMAYLKKVSKLPDDAEDFGYMPGGITSV